MRRVENEKQQQQRLASYAHLEQQERREAWQKLAYLPAVPVPAARLAAGSGTCTRCLDVSCGQ